MDEWVEHIFQRMNDPAVKRKIEKFIGRSSFLVFFTYTLKTEVALASQQEDKALMADDFNRLMLKYRPLGEQIMDELLNLYTTLRPVEEDLIQQLTTNMLAKKKKIITGYIPGKLFRNYIWSAFSNESKNLLTAELRHRNRTIALEDDFAKMLYEENRHLNSLLIADALHIFHAQVLSYLRSRLKLVVCLKILHDLPLSENDFNQLAENTERGDRNGIKKILMNQNGLREKRQRFEAVSGLLNSRGGGNADPDSYWRWGNLQVNRMIAYLNDKHLMHFNRESFGVLLERYFSDF